MVFLQPVNYRIAIEFYPTQKLYMNVNSQKVDTAHIAHGLPRGSPRRGGRTVCGPPKHGSAAPQGMKPSKHDAKTPFIKSQMMAFNACETESRKGK